MSYNLYKCFECGEMISLENYNKTVCMCKGCMEDKEIISDSDFIKMKFNKSILEEAKTLLNEDREDEYGDPVYNYTLCAEIYEKLTDKEMKKEDAVLFMIIVKLVRESYRHKRDNLVDLCAYAEIKQRCEL